MTCCCQGSRVRRSDFSGIDGHDGEVRPGDAGRTSLLVWTPALVLIDRGMDCWTFILQMVGHIVTLAAALGGAYLAYRFTQEKAADDLREQRYEAIMRAQLVLLVHYDAAMDLRLNYLNKYMGMPQPHENIPPLYRAFDSTTVEMESLVFIDRMFQGESTVIEINLAEASYRNMVKCYMDRNELLERYIMTRIDSPEKATSNERIVSAMNKVLLEDVTEAMFLGTDSAAAKLDAAIESLRKKGRALYPEPGRALYRSAGLRPE